MEMTPARWEYTTQYLRSVFGKMDPVLETLVQEARAAELPEIANV